VATGIPDVWGLVAYAAGVATPTSRERARAAIARLCESAMPTRQLRAEVLGQLQTAIGFDFYVFVLTDPTTCVGCDPLAEVPFTAELPRLIRLKYATAVNRWTTLTDPPVALLHDATGGHPERSPLWREMLARADVADVASVVFRDRFGSWGFLDLWRCAPHPAFTGVDAAFLAATAPVVTEGLRRCQAALFVDHPGGASHHEALVLLLSPELTIRAQTQQAGDYLRQLLPTEAGVSPIPAAVYNVAGQLAALEAGVDDHPAAATVHLGEGAWVTLRAARIEDGAPGDVAVTIDDASRAVRLSIFGRAFGLSTREGELLAVLAGGADTRQAATQLHLSQHTIQDHLKSIFDRTGCRSRRELLARFP
jgi:DNA-binding CsgD family transcriptional regulator